jgi:hypothetical protein
MGSGRSECKNRSGDHACVDEVCERCTAPFEQLQMALTGLRKTTAA